MAAPLLIVGWTLADLEAVHGTGAHGYLGGASAWGAILACYGGGAILGGLLALRWHASGYGVGWGCC